MNNKYENGKIYKVINTVDDKIYIGSTVRRLCDRMGNHRSAANGEIRTSKFYKHIRNLGIEHFKIVLIEAIKCNSKEELERAEFAEIQKYDKSKLLNDSIIYGKKSESHSKKVGEASTGPKSGCWKYGSVFLKQGVTKEGWVTDTWVFAYKDLKSNKQKTKSFSIKKYGYEEAQRLANESRYIIYPEAIEQLKLQQENI